MANLHPTFYALEEKLLHPEIRAYLEKHDVSAEKIRSVLHEFQLQQERKWVTVSVRHPKSGTTKKMRIPRSAAAVG